MSISKIQCGFVKKLALATLNFFKTAPEVFEDFIEMHFYHKEYRLTPLLIAAYGGDLNLFLQVQERTSNLNQTSTQYETLPIHLAAYRGHIELCRHLLEKSENKNPKGYKEFTTLHYAAVAGHLEGKKS